MTEQERTSRLEGIVETWNRVLVRHEAEMAELRRATEARVDAVDRRVDVVDRRIEAIDRRVESFERALREQYWRALLAFGIGIATIGLMIRFLPA